MSTDRWMDKDDVVFKYSRMLLNHEKRNEIIPFATTWVDLELIILKKLCQRQISYDVAYMWNLKYTNEFIPSVSDSYLTFK